MCLSPLSVRQDKPKSSSTGGELYLGQGWHVSMEDFSLLPRFFSLLLISPILV